jgi:transposase
MRYGTPSTTWGTCGRDRGMSSRQTPSERKKRALRWQVGFWLPLARVLFEDETDLLLFPPLRAGWAKRGETKQVVLSGFNDKCTLFGAIEPLTGQLHLVARKTQRGEDFCAFLRHLRAQHHPRQILVLLLDGDSSHTAKAPTALADDLGIVLLFLPKRCPHLNPVDHLWRSVKKDVCANRQYVDLDDEVDRVVNYLWALSPQEALTKSGILSPHFWLRSLRPKVCKDFSGPT